MWMVESIRKPQTWTIVNTRCPVIVELPIVPHVGYMTRWLALAPRHLSSPSPSSQTTRQLESLLAPGHSIPAKRNQSRQNLFKRLILWYCIKLSTKWRLNLWCLALYRRTGSCAVCVVVVQFILQDIWRLEVQIHGSIPFMNNQEDINW